MRAYLKSLYDAHGTLYRLFWTAVVVASGYAAGVTFHDPRAGLAAGLFVQVFSSEARKRLASE